MPASSPILTTCWLKLVLQLMKAMWCVQRFDLSVTRYCKHVFLPISCCLKVTVAKRSAGLSKLVKFIG